MRVAVSDQILRAAVLGFAALGLIAPIGAGIWYSASAAAGHMPALGLSGANLGAWTALSDVPGLFSALRLTLITGFAATALSLIVALAVAATIAHGKARAIMRVLTPFLAIPHAALAIGLAFVLAPSGWIARALAPAMGWLRPPDVATVNDPYGAALILGLTLKEMPFLVLVILAALTQIPLRTHIAAAQTLGYGIGAVWVKIILPQLWPMIRLPVYIVLIYALSAIDMALILGPSNPPTLAVLIARLFTSPDLAQLLPASMGAMLMLIVCVLSIGAVWMLERTTAHFGRAWLRRGGRSRSFDPALRALAALGAALLAIGFLSMLSLALWSLTWRWPWPNIVPETWSGAAWSNAAITFGPALQNTALIALSSVAISLALAIAWLGSETSAVRSNWAEALIYLPLLIPQISFIFGMNTLLLHIGLQGSLWAVIWAHSLFVFPYVMIALTGPWRGLDARFAQSAASLGAPRWRRLTFVKLPMLLAPLCAAAAIGVAVSVAQYLPTLFLGSGRITTLTTEAITLASSSDRRITGVVTSLQAILPFAAYLAAFLIPALAHRNRRALQGANG